MNYAAVAIPRMERLRMPLSRDQVVLLMAALNLFLLGLETYLAHLISGTIVPQEWIPILFGPIGGTMLLIAGLISMRRREAASLLATLVLLASTAVGFLGAYFHIVRAIAPFAPPGSQVTISLLIWAPPLLGPLTFCLVGLFGISAAWPETSPDSGVLRLPGGLRLPLPYSKTRAYLYAVSMGSLATVISSVLDHARTDFSNPWLWFPTAVGVFATVVAASLAALPEPRRGDVWTYLTAMVLMMLAGLLGVVLHTRTNLTSGGQFVFERFLRHAPFLAPMLFSDIGLWGLIAILPPGQDSDS
ncbi:MAG TPA: hypothetical protein ENL35_10830 [Chloroflexi bacterium]|nr:hypothetical protein [Chloroflexota bacterium]